MQTMTPKQSNQVRNQMVLIRATKAEKEMFTELAKKLKAKSVSGAIRKLAIKELKK